LFLFLSYILHMSSHFVLPLFFFNVECIYITIMLVAIVISAISLIKIALSFVLSIYLYHYMFAVVRNHLLSPTQVCAQKNLFCIDISKKRSPFLRRHPILIFLVVHCSNVNWLNFGCALVRVHTSLLWLRALCIKTKRKRKKRERTRDTCEQLCGPFCGAPFKMAAHSPGELVFHDYEKTFFCVARDFEPIFNRVLPGSVASRRSSLFQIWTVLFLRKYELYNPR